MRVPAGFILTVPVTKILLITERVNAVCDVELEWADVASEYPEASAVQKEVSKVSRQRWRLACRLWTTLLRAGPMSGCREGADIRCCAIT